MPHHWQALGGRLAFSHPVLANIDQQIREAERLTTDAPDDETLLQASASLAELREALGRVERMLSSDGTTG